MLDDFGGRLGWAWRETNADETDLETVINELLEGQYCNPVRIIGFNAGQGWSRDVIRIRRKRDRSVTYQPSCRSLLLGISRQINSAASAGSRDPFPTVDIGGATYRRQIKQNSSNPAGK